MKRTGLKRATSGVLSVAMIASALFTDFSVPTSVYASDDTSSVETALDGYSDSDGSITSEYIVENLDESLGEEAAALNENAALTVAEEYLVSELAEISDTSVSEDTDMTSADTETITETESVLTESVGVSANDADIASTSSNDVGVAALSLNDETDDSAEEIVVEETDVTSSEETEEVTVSEEDIAALAEEILDSADDIATAEDYDTNGLAPTYHYILLNYSLIDSDYVWDGMTIDDVWNEVPESFIASYLTYVNVYTLEDNEDYYVAFIDPASLNGLGSAIYADFTDLDTYNPTVYNDIITFDAETGIVYIPKSFYFNEDGGETLKELEAQVLVPYSFDNDTSTVSVSVSSDMDGVEGISGSYSVPTLDVTTTIQIVSAEDADKITLDDISLTVNDDMLPFDTSGDNAYYDTETGELTISASPNNVYSISVTIAENEAETSLAMADQREILVASTGDLSNILVADSGYTDEAYKADNAADMKTLPGVTVNVDEGSLVKGQTFTYGGAWEINTGSLAATVNAVIANTAEYTYYAQNSAGSVVEIDSDNWNQFFDSNGNIALSSSTEAQALLRAISSTVMSSTYNRMFSLPDNEQIESDDSSTKITMTANITGNPSGYEEYVAIHCVHNSQEAYYAGRTSGSDDPITLRVLYYTDSYVILSATIPVAYDQAGSSVYKIDLTTTTADYYARFGVKKTSSTTGATLSGAVFAYEIRDASHEANMTNLANFTASVSTKYSAGELTDTQLKGALRAVSMDGIYTCSSASTPSSVAISTLNGMFPSTYYNDEGYIYIYLTEVKAPTGYQRNTGVWRLKVSVSENMYSESKILSAEYFDYDVDSGTLSSTSESVEYTSGTAYIKAPNNPDTMYAALNLAKTEYGTGTYVGGAVYALVDYTSTSYGNTVLSYAQTASEAGSASAAISSFYSSMKSAGETDYLEGVYTTSSSGAVRLKSVTSSGTVSSTDKVLDLGSSTSGAYILVEIYSPSGYSLDDDYYAFVLYSTNTTEDYATAVKATKMVYNLHNADELTFSGNNTTANLVATAVDKAYTSHTVSKVRSGTVTNDLVKGVVVQLYSSTDGGTTYSATQYTATLSDAYGWTHTWENLPKYTSSGVEYKYKAEEIIVLMEKQFDTGTTTYSVSGDNIETVFTVKSTTASGKTTITNTINTTDVSVKKDFYDSTAKDRIKSVVFELYRSSDGGTTYSATGETVTLSTDNWTGTFEDLVKYDTTGTAYTYTVKEKSVTYEDMWGNKHTVTDESIIKTLFNPTVSTSNGTVTVKNHFYTTSRYATKIFGNDETSRLTKITTILYADGKSMESLGMTTTLSSSNSWTNKSSAWTGLDTYDYTGSEIDYTVEETSATYVDSLGDEYTVDGSKLIKLLFDPEYGENGSNETITNYYKTVTYTIEKELSGTLANTLIKSVTVRLYRNDVATDKTYTLNSTKGWSYTWEGLDRYDSSGNEYEYTVKEETVVMNDQFFTGTTYTISETNLNKVFNVSTTTSDGQTTITNTIPPTYLNVEKKFDTYTEGRVTAVVVELYRNDEATGEKLTLSDSNNWASSFTDLVKYDENGDAYSYKAVEVSVTYNDMWGKSRTVDDRNIIKTIFEVTETTSGNKTTVTNKLNTTTHTVVKTMGSDTTESIVYSVTARLYADGVSAYSVFGDRVLSESNNWTDTWDGYNASGKWVGLDKYDYQGNEIKYTSKEVSVDVMDQYDTKVISTVKDALNTVFTVITSTKNGITTVDNTVGTIDLTVEKTFGVDTKDRVSQVIVTLYRNGKAMPATLTLDTDNNWTDTFTNLVKYDPDGNEYEYTAVETSVTYTDMWGKEHKVDDRSIITKLFTVTETTKNYKTTVKNTFNTVDHDVSKAFADALTKSLVTSVTSELFADGASLESVFGNKTLSADNSWSDTWKDLDEYDYKGNLIKYTVKEIEVTMRDQFHMAVISTVAEDNVNTVFDVDIVELDGETEIENDVVTIPHFYVQKEFGVNTKDRISEVVVTLYRNGEAQPYTLTLNEANNWADTFDDLVKFDPNGNPYIYTAVETSVTYTDMWGDTYTVEDRTAIENLFAVEEVTTNNTKTVITNTFQFTERTVMKLFATKITSDRLVQVTARLYADGKNATELFGDKILNEDNNWTDTWTGYAKDGTTWIGLDKYDHNGVEIDYTTTEIQAIYTDKDSPEETQHIVSGGTLITIFEPVYDDDVNETTSSITNELQTVDLKVIKTWGDFTESHLVSIQVELWENNNPTGKIVTLSKDNNWTYTWEELDKYDSIARPYKYEAKEISVTYTDMWGDEYTVTPGDLMFVLFDVETETEDGVTTIKNTYKTTEYTVSKTFGSTLTESLVTSVTAMLTADGKDAESAFANLVLTEDNSWTSTWYGIDMYDHEGNVIEYGAKEVSLTMKDQYDATVISTVKKALETVFDVVITPKEGETVIDNTVVTTEHTVVKKFGENTDGRITEVEVTLYRNGKAMPATLTLNEANGWTNTFTDLVKYDPDGNEYEYSAVETKVTYNDMWGTSHTITDEKIINTVFDVDAVTADNTTTITNTIVVTKHNVVKTFGSDLTESLVESIVAELFANKVSLLSRNSLSMTPTVTNMSTPQ